MAPGEWGCRADKWRTNLDRIKYPGLFGSPAQAANVLAKGQGLSTLLETVVRQRIADLSF